MAVRSQYLPMSFEEYDLLPYQHGCKYDYRDGCVHITLNHRTVVTVDAVTQRPVNTLCTVRYVLLNRTIRHWHMPIAVTPM
jgi:hypothetical protein